MLKLINILLLLSTYLSIYSQGKNDNWIFGFQDTIYRENCGKILWNNSNGDVEFRFIETELNFESTCTAISDTAGKLLLFTNGCAIAGSNYEIIKNGKGINPGTTHTHICNSTGYTIPDGAMFLPVNNDKYILLHLGIKDEFNMGIYGPLYYTIVTKNNNEFEVTEKNIIIKDDTIESFAVVRHSNGKDWWIIAPKYKANKYYRFLFADGKIEEKSPQITSLILPDEYCKITGLSKFSPNGKKYIRYNKSCGYLLFDFNRCTGLISNGIFESVGYFINDIASDFIFSPDSKILYITKMNHHRYSSWYLINKIHKIYLDQIGVKADPYIEMDLPIDYRLGRFYMDNDSSIYVLNAYSNDFLHTINQDNTNSNFLSLYSFLPLPVLNAQTVPYFANFSLGKINCDETITEDLKPKKAITFSSSPNPFSDDIQIKTTDKSIKYKIKVLDLQGKTIIRFDSYFKGDKKINIPSLNQGIYIIELTADKKHYFIKTIKI